MARYFRQQEALLRDQGVVLPRTRVTVANEIDTHAALREVLVRRQTRARTLQRLEQQASSMEQSTCLDSRGSQARSWPAFIPQVLFQPSTFDWEPPRPGRLHSNNITLLKYDDTEMRRLVEDVSLLLNATSLRRVGNDASRERRLEAVYDQLKQTDDRIQLWALCAVYLYGGFFVGNHYTDDPIQMKIVDDVLFRYEQSIQVLASSPVAIVLLASDMTSQMQNSVRFLAASPRHGHLGCLLLRLSQSDSHENVNGGLIRRMFPFLELESRSSSDPDSWLRWTLQNGWCGLSTCTSDMESAAAVGSDVLRDHALAAPICALYTRCIPRNSHPFTQAGLADSIMNVAIRERANRKSGEAIIDTKQRKSTLQSQMRSQGIEPGWLCNRCLGWAAFGTYEKCRSVCPKGLQAFMCDAPDQVSHQNIDITVAGWPTSFTNHSQRAIPRIVHQTWFEEITWDRYPQLARLQASWKSSGWEFRFYSDDAARAYVVDYFPTQFVGAFDALIHGAFKADLFRYLVLLREGGIYADVDVVKLGVPLDFMVTSSTTFFAPRDIPCEYAGEAFCLWNGFIGSAPGHPVIVQAVERLVNLVNLRADMYDMERDTCRRSGGATEVWKVRSQPLLFLSGPCALGVAMNEALQRPLLGRLPIGWISLEKFSVGGKADLGDILVLVADKYDLGQFRISHPDNGAMIASTDMSGLEKSPRDLQNPTEGDLRRLSLARTLLPHYSNSKRGVSIWGMANVYHDNFVAYEPIQLSVKFT
jgi:Glycosyltransferase sugar-binding region containing DXD motif